jgi:hypothetical protein
MPSTMVKGDEEMTGRNSVCSPPMNKQLEATLNMMQAQYNQAIVDRQQSITAGNIEAERNTDAKVGEGGLL